MQHKAEIRNLRTSIRQSLGDSSSEDANARPNPATVDASSLQRVPSPALFPLPASHVRDEDHITRPAVPRASSRSGADLWNVALNRVRAVQTVQKAPDLMDKLMFSLTPRTGSHMSLQRAHLDSEQGGIRQTLLGGRDRNALPPSPPALFAPGSDARHLFSMIQSSYLNMLLLAVPLGIIFGLLHFSPSLVFSVNFLALLPLALMLGEITEDLALRFGDTIGGLLNATFGNVVEMILSIVALSKGLYTVVAASLIGSVLSNLLLVLGFCFFIGGLKYKQQYFNPLANKVSSSLLFLSTIGIIIPTAAKGLYGPEVITPGALKNLSHAISLLLVSMYGCYLYFQLKTHAVEVGERGGAGNPSSSNLAAMETNGHDQGNAPGASSSSSSSDDDNCETTHSCTPALSLTGAIVALSSITALVAVHSEYLTGALEAVAEIFSINPTFLGLVVLPIAGNAAEHITAVFVAHKDKMDLAIAVALGSSIQIALFVLPIVVLTGWAIGKNLTLDFDPFAVLMMNLSVILAYFVSSDGSSNWLLGVQLIATYCAIGFVFLLEKEE